MLKKALFIFALLLSVGIAVVWWYGNNAATSPDNSAASSQEQTEVVSNEATPSEPVESESEAVTLVAVGDVMMSRHVWTKILAHGGDSRHPFRETADFTAAADITFANVESAVSDLAEPPPEGMSFIVPTEGIDGLEYAGFDVVSLANNHSLNFGKQALVDSVEQLESRGILTAGAGDNLESAHAPAILDVKGNSIAFFAYQNVGPQEVWEATPSSAGIAWMDPEMVKLDVSQVRDEVDYVIVSMHAGTEYVFDPIDSQVEFAHAAVDAGADLVIGHHPHVVQDKEIYNGKQIIYSLGNFVFDQMWSEETRRGEVLTATLTDGEVRDINFEKVRIYDYNQPRFEDW